MIQPMRQGNIKHIDGDKCPCEPVRAIVCECVLEDSKKRADDQCLACRGRGVYRYASGRAYDAEDTTVLFHRGPGLNPNGPIPSVPW